MNFYIKFFALEMNRFLSKVLNSGDSYVISLERS